MRRRRIGGVTFESRPGRVWVSADERLALVHTVDDPDLPARDRHEQWELWITSRGLGLCERLPDPPGDALQGRFIVGAVEFTSERIALAVMRCERERAATP